MIDDLRADYKRNRRAFDRISVTAFRINQAAHRGRFRLPKRIFAKVIDTLWLQLVVGADLDGRATVGPGLKLPHGGRMVGIDPGAVIGSNVTIFPNSGPTRGGPRREWPIVGDNVTFGRNSTVVGPVTVGDGAFIGGNSIAIDDIAPGQTVMGIPAVPIREIARRRSQERRTQSQAQQPG